MMISDHILTSALDVGVGLEAHGALHPPRPGALVPRPAGLRPGGVTFGGRAVEAAIEEGGQAAAVLGLGEAVVGVGVAGSA